ncbi:MAG TPA: glycosyltransferase family 4 protein [Saprospiraceae bacterium]|nr:glycosyltransferase family 4 protein [Saprospiraceae bacterium]
MPPSKKNAPPAVLHLSSPLSWRGGEQQLYYLYKELDQLDVKQFLFASESGALSRRFEEEALPVFTFKKSFSLNPMTARKLAMLARHLKVDLVHAHDSHAHSIAVIASSLFGMKQPIILHRRVDFKPKKSPLKLWKYNHQAIAKIICISEKIKLGLSDLIHDQKKLTTIHSCVDPQRFKNKSTGKLRKELGLSTNTPIVANIAALTPEKDYPTWLKAASIILKKRPECHFTAFGAGEEYLIKLNSFAQELKIKSQVHFMGHRTDLSELMSDVDVLMFTSKKEGLGTSILDAFCCDIPVVATNTGGIPELIQHGQTGLLAEIGASEEIASYVLDLLNQQSLRDKLTYNARESLKNFTCQNMARRIKRIYQLSYVT